MLSISAICAALSAPIARPEAGVEGAATPAGEGVAGAAVAVGMGGWDGAGGGAGVEATAGAGVEGAFEDEAVEAGVALGCQMLENNHDTNTGSVYTFETMQTMNPFSSIL